MFTLFIFHTCSGTLRCLWKIRIFIRFSFSEVSQGRYWIAYIIKKFYWYCHKVWKVKMDLVKRLVTAMNEELPTVTVVFNFL